MSASPSLADRLPESPVAADAWLRACVAPSACVDVDGRVLASNAAFAQRLSLSIGQHLVDRDARLVDMQTVGHGGPISAIDGGHLHVRPLGAGTWLAQWLHAPVDAAAEQRQLQMFADTVAHDLRAPLRSIESFAKLLDDRASARLDTAERMHLSRIRAAATRMHGLLAALGELSRAASAAMQPTEVDLSLLAEWALAELHDAEPGRDVITEVQGGMHVVGDERLLRQMLRELLRNAWTFTRNAQPARIDVQGERIGTRLRITICDSGSGFDMQYAHKLFQPFQRLHGVDQGAGHGLGLAIAQRIAQRHGGGITADAIEGRGAAFVVDLPIANVA